MSFLSKMMAPRQRRAQAFTEPFWSGWFPASRSGQQVTVESALQVTTVLACLRVIAEGVAQVPLNLHRKRKDKAGGSDVADDHPLHWLLSTRPNAWQTSFEFFEQLVFHTALCGRFIAFKNVVRGEVKELIPFLPHEVCVDVDQFRRPIYRVSSEITGQSQDFPASAIWHVKGPSWNGVDGLKPLQLAREAIGLAMATEEAHALLHANGAQTSGLYSVEDKLLPDQFLAMRNWVEKNLTGENRFRPLILDRGAKWTSTSMTGVDAQHLECVVAGTRISMADGTRKAAEDIRPGDVVIGWDNGPVPARVAFVGAPPVKELVRVTTARGRVLDCTFDHPFLAKRSLTTPGSRECTKPAEWVQAGQLEPGYYVRAGLGRVDSADFQPMDAEAAWFLGAMVGDGYIRNGGCSISATEPNVISRASRFVESTGGSLRQSKSRPQDYHINSGGTGRVIGKVRQLFRDAGLEGQASHTKRVPSMIMLGGPEAWKHFMAGYLDTDGTVSKPGAKTPLVSWTSVNRSLLEDCQHMLAMLGVQSSIYIADPARRRLVMGQECDARDTWALLVYGASQLTALASMIVPAHAEKRQRLERFKTLPPSRYKAGNFLYDRVIKVERLGPGETIGIEIEGVHTHITNGLVTHNTRRHQIEEICRVFRCAPLMVGYSDKTATYASAEQMFLAHVVHCLAPWYRRIEQSINANLLTDAEARGGLYSKFNPNALMRGAARDRAEFYFRLWSMGALNANEIRAYEDQNPYEGGEIYRAPVNMGDASDPTLGTPGAQQQQQPVPGEDSGEPTQARGQRFNVGRVLSARNERRIRDAEASLQEVLDELDDQKE